MRELNKIVIHCSATEQGHDISVGDITKMHKARGFRTIGYHYVINLVGKIERGRPISEQGAHVKGHNKNSIGICYIGGLINRKPKDTRTVPQIHALRGLVEGLKIAFDIKEVVGHRDLSPDINKDGKITKDEWLKACPCFDVKTQL